ncbi:MAG: DUF1566 domain-containing protein [Deltaproteobacteria bacterium]|nr:DUF1566 domain-containing protein [Deltaproteobacteria bacterium]MBN2673576.1 DUF1566 domain-containing protein [Deltaproteobacteria bacterium]
MRKLALLLVIFVISACSSSPEGTRDGDCGDGKDNDKNGFIDCEDEGCNLEDICIQAAAKAKLAEEAAKEAAAPPKPQVPVPEDDGKPYIEVDKMWVQKGHNGDDISQPAAKHYCDTLQLAGRNDWRLPTESEAVAASNSQKLPLEPLVMWTSTEKSKKRAVIVGITTGAINDLGVHSVGQCRARCVRDN